MVVVVEFERNLIRERVNSRLTAAKVRGVKLGRPATVHEHVAEIGKLKKRGLGVRAIARELKLPPSSVCKELKLKGGLRAATKQVF